MKILVLLLQIIIVAPIASQELKDVEPMSDRAFERYYKRLQRYDNDEKLLIESIDRLKDNYITSNHAFIVAQLFDTDKARLDFASLIYHRVSDELNILEVCDAFQRISYAIRFYDYVREQREIRLNDFQDTFKIADSVIDDKPSPSSEKKPDPEKTDIEPDTEIKEEAPLDNQNIEIIYPEAKSYQGEKNCETPISENVFSQFLDHLNKVQSDSEKVKICLDFAPEQCFTTQQVMKIAESITNLDYRFALIRTFSNFVYDPENFHYTHQLFDSKEYMKK